MRDHHKLASSGVSEKQPIYLRSSLALMFAIMLHIRCHESQTAEKKGIKSYTDVCNYKNIILTARLSQKSHGATYDVCPIGAATNLTEHLSHSNSPDTPWTQQSTSSKRSATSTGSSTRTTTASSTSRSTRSSCPSAISSPFIW